MHMFVSMLVSGEPIQDYVEGYINLSFMGYVYQVFCNMLFFLCYKGKGVLFIIGVYVSNSAISCLTCILKIKAYL